MITLTASQQFTLGVLGAALLVFGTNNPAQAAVLVNNGVPDLQLAIRSDFNFSVEAGDDFTLTTSNDVTNITWSGLYAGEQSVSTNPAIDQFSIRIFKFLGDRPAIVPLVAFDNVTVNRLGTSNPFFFNYSFAPTQPLTLKSGKYLLSVVNNTPSDTTLDWFWATSQQDGDDVGRFQSDDAWFDDRSTAELSFTVEGNRTPVPTPALLPGLIGLGLNVWRKRK